MINIFHPVIVRSQNTGNIVQKTAIVSFTCNPVSLYTIINAESYRPKSLLAVDSVPARLELAKSLGAEPWNFQTDREGFKQKQHLLG